MESGNNDIVLLMVALNALGVVLFAIGMFLLKNFSDKLDRLIDNQAKFNSAIAVLQANDRNKTDLIENVQSGLSENISANRANIDTAYKIMESNKREIKEDLSDRFHRVNSSVQKLMLEIAKGERNGKGL